MNQEQTPPKKRFKLFDSQREGRGITKEQANLPPNLKKFFILYRRDFGRLLSVNILMVLGNFPVLFWVLAFSGIMSIDYAVPAVGSYPIFSGISIHEGLSAPMLALRGILGVQSSGSTFMPIAYVFIVLGFLTLFTFGPVNVGTAYILRNMVKGDPVFVWSDFWYAVRRNFKHGLLFGILDLILVVLIPVNILILSGYSGFWNGILFWLNIVIGIVYLTMRRYIYIQMVTFDLSMTKILKNALIFSVIGFKRNVLAFLGILALVLITLLCAYSGFLLSLAIVLPLLLLFSNASYMTTYAAYFKIKEHMIDPYNSEQKDESQETA